MFRIKRIYDEPNDDDGIRILVDRIWPRGISKEKAKLDYWYKNVAPSTELRKSFCHDPNKFKDFTVAYKQELIENNHSELEDLIHLGETKTVTLLFASKDEKHNQAIVLLDYLNKGSFR